MPIVAESAWSAQTWSDTNEGLVSITWDVDMPPTPAFVKVVMGDYGNLGEFAFAELGLINIRSRQADGSDLTMTFPVLDDFANRVYTSFDGATTHVTFGLAADSCHASAVWSIETWE